MAEGSCKQIFTTTKTSDSVLMVSKPQVDLQSRLVSDRLAGEAALALRASTLGFGPPVACVNICTLNKEEAHNLNKMSQTSALEPVRPSLLEEYPVMIMKQTNLTCLNDVLVDCMCDASTTINTLYKAYRSCVKSLLHERIFLADHKPSNVLVDDKVENVYATDFDVTHCIEYEKTPNVIVDFLMTMHMSMHVCAAICCIGSKGQRTNTLRAFKICITEELVKLKCAVMDLTKNNSKAAAASAEMANYVLKCKYDCECIEGTTQHDLSEVKEFMKLMVIMIKNYFVDFENFANTPVGSSATHAYNANNCIVDSCMQLS